MGNRIGNKNNKLIMSLIFWLTISTILLSTVGAASAANAPSAANADTTQIILRTKFLYEDRINNGHRIQINITSNRIGNLIYLEEYYKIDQDGNPQLFNSLRCPDDTNKCFTDQGQFNNFDNSISFEIVRPRMTNGYSLIKGIVIFDGQRTYETWINSSATYKYGISSNRNSTVKRLPPVVEKREFAQFNASQSHTNPNVTPKAGEELPLALMAISMIYILGRRKSKRR
jgi:hypothetical protein